MNDDALAILALTRPTAAPRPPDVTPRDVLAAPGAHQDAAASGGG
ncbi:hypothetical protein [Gemmata sp.]